MSRDGTPTWSVDTLTVSGELTTDDLGREWGVRAGGDDGWVAPPSMRTSRTDRVNAHGSFRAAGYREARQLTLSGFVACPDAATRERTELQLAALCSDPGRLYDYRRYTNTTDLVVAVELDDQPKIEMVTLYRLDWEFVFAAPDPRKHDFQVQAPIAGPPTTSASGLDFTAPGLDFSGAGLDFGAPALPQPVSVGNYGTAPAAPVIQVFGPATNPVVRCITSGQELIYSAPLAEGEVLTVNCDRFVRDGFPARRAVSNVHGDVRNYLSLSGWPSVDPGAVETFTLLSEVAPTTQLRVILRSAWW